MDQAHQLTAFIRSVRSVRRFSDKPLPDDVLMDILNTGRWTGSAKNTQPWRLVVVENRETLQALSECGQFAGHLAGAPCAVALVMDDRRSSLDCGRLAENIMLAAWAHGVGSCIGSIWPDGEARAKDLLGVPQERSLTTTVSLGYPADSRAARLSLEAPGSPIPLGRRPMEELVSWERLGRQPGSR